MAYMRGYAYLWHDESRLHIWVADGDDGWQESGWHLLDDGKDYPIQPQHLKDGQNAASGVSIPQEIMDEYVIMRLCELIENEMIADTITRTVAKWSRPSLQRNVELLKSSFKEH